MFRGDLTISMTLCGGFLPLEIQINILFFSYFHDILLNFVIMGWNFEVFLIFTYFLMLRNGFWEKFKAFALFFQIF